MNYGLPQFAASLIDLLVWGFRCSSTCRWGFPAFAQAAVVHAFRYRSTLLLSGSAGMYANLLLLRRTVQNAVYHGRTRTIGGYLLRLVIASAVIAAD